MPEELHDLISAATKRNWNRLNVENTAQRLTARANKRMSKKNVIPLEYAASPDSVEWLRTLMAEITQNGWDIPSVMYSLCIRLLRAFSLEDLPHVKSAFSDLSEYSLIEPLLSFPLPEDEHDLLGLIYQSLLSEGARNQKGAYYTPPSVVQDMTQHLSAVSGTCLDPCCGSGAFLRALLQQGIPPENIFGCDRDPVAVMLARVNLLIDCRFSDCIPKVVCADFLCDSLPFPDRLDCIITNPPWGALSEKMNFSSLVLRESFSCFLYAACQRLSECGRLHFLLPESFLNVRTHRSIRRYLLTQQHIREIRFYDQTFSGVTTRFVSVSVCRAAEDDLICLRRANAVSHVPVSFYLRSEDCILLPLDETDLSILKKIYTCGAHTLQGSTWALGIVTGDNKTKLLDAPQNGCESVLTGREVEPYRLRPARKYIRYDRPSLQQAAPDEYYRTGKKLIYRFISDRPVFALDTGGTLCLNSANILIPRVGGLSIYTVLALLNSAPIQYLYMKQFGGVKVLKSHLEKLPFPALTEAQDASIAAQVQKILSADDEVRPALQEEINEHLFSLYGFSEAEVQRVRNTLSPSATTF